VCRLAIINAAKRDLSEFQSESGDISYELIVKAKLIKQDFLNAIEEIANRLK